MIGKSQRMVSCGSGDDTFLFLLLVKQKKRIPGTAFFERPGLLQVLHLCVNLATKHLGEDGRVTAGGAHDAVRDAGGGGNYFVVSWPERHGKQFTVPKFRVPPSVVLASASPRRQELLKKVVRDFIADPADLDEDALTLLDPFQTAEKLALAKAESVAQRHFGKWVLGSDTVVALPWGDGSFKQFGKPRDIDEAFDFLNELCGKTHLVITGVAIVTPDKSVYTHAVAEVEFNIVSQGQLNDYVQTGEPMDKAGAYGAQGMGAFLVKELRGDFETVVGLPTGLVRTMLQELDYPFEP